VAKKLRTAFSIILLAGDGERTILVYRGAAEQLSAKAIPWKTLKAKWFYISSVGGDLSLMHKLIAHADKHKIKVAWNPGSKELKQGYAALAPLIEKVDIFNLNKEEAALLAGTKPSDIKATIAKLHKLPRKVLVVTDGKEGSYATVGGKTWHSGIIDVPRINVTGAGDSFGSGMVAGLLKKDDIPYAMAVGTWNATGVVQQMGAKKGLIRKYPTPAMTKQVPIAEWP
jgi:sugar/nucleoside kinase (ribokinase family)